MPYVVITQASGALSRLIRQAGGAVLNEVITFRNELFPLDGSHCSAGGNHGPAPPRAATRTHIHFPK